MNQIHFSTVLAVYCALVLFGLAFNWLTAWAERNHYIEGFTAFFVALGVFVTLAATAVFNPDAALLTFGAFIASGSPMIFGSVWRYIATRKKEQSDDRQAAALAECGKGRS